MTLTDRLKVNVEASVPGAPLAPGPPAALLVAERAPAVSPARRRPDQKQKVSWIVYQPGYNRASAL